MSRIVCVSNRVALPGPVTGEIKAGGLAVGVRAALEGQGGGVWFGWSGDKIASASQRTVNEVEQNGVTFLTIPLTEDEYTSYYKHMANSGLWPFMHELGEYISEDGSSFQKYKAVTATFAGSLKEFLKPDDIIWVHDYHLMALGRALRKLGVANQILYFHHVPLPRLSFVMSPVVPRGLRAAYDDLVQDLFAYNSVGFQSFRDFNNFKNYIGSDAITPKRFTPTLLSYRSLHTSFGVFPISVETRDLENEAKTNFTTLRPEPSDTRIIIGAERLDYTKGIVQRMTAFSRLLQHYPQHRNAVKYIQVTPLTRHDIVQYQKTINETRAAVRDIQRQYGTSDWQPIEYSENTIERDILMGYFRQADVGLVTPFMDGQNLIAKEFIAAQDPKNPGVLVLSRYAGAAEELGELGIPLIDPHNIDDIAAKLNLALTMPLNQRVDLHHRALVHLRRYDIHAWAEAFLRQAQPGQRMRVPLAQVFRPNPGVPMRMMATQRH